jgi:hypothetical protein
LADSSLSITSALPQGCPSISATSANGKAPSAFRRTARPSLI